MFSEVVVVMVWMDGCCSNDFRFGLQCLLGIVD